MSSGEENGNRIYIYKNDPKVVKKGVNITDVRYPQGGYLPLLTDTPYNERKFDNTSYKYDDRFHHGSRPMHRSTFTLSHVQSSNDINRPISSSYDTQNNYVMTFLEEFTNPNPALYLFDWPNLDVSRLSA